MDDKNPIKSKKTLQEVSKLNLNKSPTYESYLDKKARNIFVGWQKRYFVFLEEKLIIYTERKENKKVKGFFSIKKISNVKSLEGNTFSLEYEGRTFMLRAQNQEIKNKWIEKIKNAFTLVKKGSLNDNNTSFENKTLFNFIFRTDLKIKLSSISSKMGKIAKKYGYILNLEDNSSSKLLLEKFGIDKLINLNDNKIFSHIHYGFMYLKQRLNDTFDQRWFFLFSRSCLYNDEININNKDLLEDKRQKKWIKFETLYYFKSNKEISNTDINIILYEEAINMDECNKITNYEKNGKYFICIDYKDRIYELYCETRLERDEWFEALINSKKIAKIIKYSITNHPRNIDELYHIFIKDKKSFYEKINQEIISITGNTEEISDFDIFEFTINNLRNFIESNLDGCILSRPIKTEFLKAYVEYVDEKILNMFKNFWDKYYNNLSKNQVIKMGSMLLNYYDEVNVFNVSDINLLINGKEFAQFFFQNIFSNIIFSIENTIKYVLEHKGSKNKEGLYYTEGPRVLFDLFWKFFDLVQDMKHKVIYGFLIKILNILIFQYCLGINCVLSNRWIIIEDEFLLSISNDTLSFNELINGFIEKFKNSKLYTEEEINQEIQIKKLIGIIDKLNNNAVIHLVYEHKALLEKEIDKQKYLKMDLIKIIKKSAEIYAKYKSLMNNRVIKIFYNEILKITLCCYISKLITISNKKIKKDELISKIKKDKDIFFEAFSDIIGQYLTNSTLILLDYIINLLEINKNQITNPILNIRQYIGPAFTYSVAKELIKLRSDLSKDEIIHCKQLCEEVLNYYCPIDESPSTYFQMLSAKVKKNDKDKEYIQIKASQLKFGDELINNEEKEENKLALFKTDMNEINDNNYNYNDSDIDEEIRSSIAVNIMKEKNYIKTSMIEFFQGYDNDNHNINNYNNNDDLNNNSNEIMDKIEEMEEENEIKEDVEEETKPDYEGFIYKKIKKNYIKYYYQIKNCSLYWFEKQTSTKPENKISLENITIINSKEEPNKFSIKSNYKGGIQEDQFKCNSQEEKNNLINAISKVRNDSKEIFNLIKFPKIMIKERKKVIKDYFKINNKLDEVNIEKDITELLKTGNYFKIDKKKFEKEIKNNIEKEKNQNIKIGNNEMTNHKKSFKFNIKKFFK